MKRMSMGQTVLRTCLALILFVLMIKDFSTFAVRYPDLSKWVQGVIAYLPESLKKPVLALVLSLAAIGVIVLLFFLSGKVISLVLRIVGRDPVKQYRKYSQACREHMGDVENRLQLERPVYTSARIRKFCVRTLLILACMLVFFLVVFRVANTLGRVPLGMLLGLLAALGVLVVYFLIWMAVKTVSGRFVRIRKIKK